MKISTIAISTIVGLSLTSLPASASDVTVSPAFYTEDTGSAERIESGDYLRIYSQQVAAAACYYYNDIDAELSVALLQEARVGFDLHLAAILNGNPDLGIIGGEERRITLEMLDDVAGVWSGMADAVDVLLAKRDDSGAVGVIKDNNLELLALTSKLLSELEGQYANPFEITQADVLTIEIVGRQAMVSQQIAKNVCKIWSGNTSEDVRAELAKEITIYETSLRALIDGMPSVGLKPAPTEAIAADLQEIRADWQVVKPIVDAVLEGSTDKDDLVYFFAHMAEETHKLEEVTHKYVVFSKHDN